MSASASAEDRVVGSSIGFREIRTEGQTILLNGKPIKLRGICAHEDDHAGWAGER